MTALSVNLNKVALLRNARGRNFPDLNQVALDCIRFGADGITLHPRPDERHARRSDIYALKEILPVELNVEGYPSAAFIQMILDTKPAQCTLVPDPPGALTSDAGWDTQRHRHLLMEIISRMKAAGVRTSIFIGTDLDMIGAAHEIGADRIELYTEPYATAFPQGAEAALAPFARAAAFAHELGLGVNAGHDLDQQNLGPLLQAAPMIAEVSIGHALITEALYEGLAETIGRYQSILGK